MLAIENPHKNVNLVNTNYHHGYTPLLKTFSNYDIVGLLIQKYVNNKTDTGNTTLISAIINGHFSNNHIDVIKILLDNGVSINIFDDTTLTITIADKYNDIVKLLLQKIIK
jgi:ankyrin repeat protein